MPQTEEAGWWFDAVYRAVQKIPPGHCTTYGHIALLLGFPKRPRQVGICLKHIPSFDPANPDRHYFHEDNVPWQRVVNAKGGISPRADGVRGVSVRRQTTRLRSEGVEVNEGRGTEESWVDLDVYGWFPTHLPGDGSDDDANEEAEGSPAVHVAESARSDSGTAPSHRTEHRVDGGRGRDPTEAADGRGPSASLGDGLATRRMCRDDGWPPRYTPG